MHALSKFTKLIGTHVFHNYAVDRYVVISTLYTTLISVPIIYLVLYLLWFVKSINIILSAYILFPLTNIIACAYARVVHY